MPPAATVSWMVCPVAPSPRHLLARRSTATRSWRPRESDREFRNWNHTPGRGGREGAVLSRVRQHNSAMRLALGTVRRAPVHFGRRATGCSITPSTCPLPILRPVAAALHRQAENLAGGAPTWTPHDPRRAATARERRYPAGPDAPRRSRLVDKPDTGMALSAGASCGANGPSVRRPRHSPSRGLRGAARTGRSS